MSIYVNVLDSEQSKFPFVIGDNNMSRVLSRDEVVQLIKDLTEELAFFDSEVGRCPTKDLNS